MQAWDPASCLARVGMVNGRRQLTGAVREIWRPVSGRAWDGRPYFCGVTTMSAPNGPHCNWGGGDWNESMVPASSFHTGGAQAVWLTDRFSSFPKPSTPVTKPLFSKAMLLVEMFGGPSNYGVWGALGTETVSQRRRNNSRRSIVKVSCVRVLESARIFFGFVFSFRYSFLEFIMFRFLPVLAIVLLASCAAVQAHQSFRELLRSRESLRKCDRPVCSRR